ncbi:MULTISPECIES: hypothetical protein [Streptosporangium]|uniref:HNH nuclease domain-containing protein n=1 Tax=Streptosporangium brasiliense TaxID=47480 RepID=A0ABT9RMF6_9ACTN|nr:hypothetical protein [Streptosporangium brasiliense]MDP9870450.1 hypothetical protein [Streptosporangium brasiliense]
MDIVEFDPTDPLLSKARNRLMHLVNRRTPTGCWLVKPTGASRAYGRLMVNRDYDLAHRWSYRIYFGPIPAGHRVFRTCRTDNCVAPEHLYARKAEPRTRVAFDRRRTNRPRAKLTWESVALIRASTNTDTALAEEYGVHRVTIRDVRSFKSWVTR